jgi:hypothetical protein
VSALLALDLSPLAATLTDLHGRTTVADFSEFGCSFSSRIEGWTPELGATLRETMEAARAVVYRATKAELVAFIGSRGRTAWASEKRDGLRSLAMIVIMEAKCPRKFVNPKEPS